MSAIAEPEARRLVRAIFARDRADEIEKALLKALEHVGMASFSLAGGDTELADDWLDDAEAAVREALQLHTEGE
jgi:hypothetical protein